MKTKKILSVIVGFLMCGIHVLAQNSSYGTQFSEDQIEDTIKVVAHVGNYCEDIELTCPAVGNELCMFSILSDSSISISIRFINKEGEFYNNGNYFYKDAEFTSTYEYKQGYYYSNIDFSSETTIKIGFMAKEGKCISLLLVREKATKFGG
ncbi:hypothetical protein COB64_02330 [Candidatus Wolfebacteria bacterium]|nr:MAG: hypothetical protein COB64_02330 [Candidatus Wolfebacteria bacterium]